jgi:hypothetical protein
MIGVLAELERMKFGRKMKLTPVQTVKARKLIVALSRSRCGLLNLTSDQDFGYSQDVLSPILRLFVDGHLSLKSCKLLMQ